MGQIQGAGEPKHRVRDKCGETESVTIRGTNLKDTNKVLDDGFTLFCEVPMR